MTRSFLFFSLLVVLLFAAYGISAQSVITIDETKKGFVYSDESAIRLDLRTNGFEVGYMWGSYETFYKYKYYNISVGNVKDPREYSTRYNLPQIGAISSSYAYGKINSLFQIKGAIGVRKSFSEKTKSDGVIIGYNYEYGLNLGILKPYVLRIAVPGEGGRNEALVYYSEETADIFLNQNLTRSHAGFRSGWDNVKLRPGLNGRAGLNFSFGRDDQFVRALEAGVDASLYFNAVDLMVDSNKPYFINLYVSLQLGWRN